MRVRVSALLLWCLLALPLVSAGQDNGTFMVRGDVTSSPGVSFTGPPLAFFAGDTSGTTAFQVRAGAARVWAYEEQFHVVGTLRVSAGVQERMWSVRDAAVRLVDGGDHAGYLGLYPGTHSRIDMQSPSSEARAASSFGTAEVATSDTQNVRHYFQTISQPHVMSESTGSVTYFGNGALKIVGLDFEIVQPTGNTTKHTTGSVQGATQHTYSWVYLEFLDAATVALELPQAYSIATTNATFAGSGVLSFTAIQGELRSRGRVYSASGTTGAVEGDFVASLTPTSDGRAGWLRLDGDLTPSSSFVSHPAPASITERGASFLLGSLALGAVVVGGGVATILYRRRRVRPHRRKHDTALRPFTAARDVEAAKQVVGYNQMLADIRVGNPELDYMSGSFYLVAHHIAEETEDWQAAYDIARTLRTLEPTSADFAVKEGRALYRMGDVNRAFSAFLDAVRLSGGEPAEAHLWSARCLARLGATEHALDHVARALAVDAAFVGDVEDCRDFDTLREHPDFKAAVKAARARIGAEPGDDA